MTPLGCGLAAAAGSLFLDQASKLAILYGLGFKAAEDYVSIPILPFFNLTMVRNHGVSYGLFPAHSSWGVALLVFLSFLAVIGLGWWLWNAPRRALTVGLGLVIGGAIGNNLVDRLIYGWVADFFDFHGFGYHWYVFNVADAAITFGVIALLYDALMRPESGPEPEKRRSVQE